MPALQTEGCTAALAGWHQCQHKQLSALPAVLPAWTSQQPPTSQGPELSNACLSGSHLMLHTSPALGPRQEPHLADAWGFWGTRPG